MTGSLCFTFEFLAGLPGPKALPPRQHQALIKPGVAAVTVTRGRCTARVLGILSLQRNQQRALRGAVDPTQLAAVVALNFLISC